MIQFLETTASTGNILLTMVLPMVLVIGFMYLIIYVPQKRQDKKDAAMRNSIEIGDEISTIGGFIGRVVSIKDDVLVIESSSDRTKLKIYRWAIRGKEAPATETVERPRKQRRTQSNNPISCRIA